MTKLDFSHLENPLFAGVDESNNGRWPTIFAGVCSHSYDEIEFGEYHKIRRRKFQEPFLKKAIKMDYSFVILTKEVSDRLPKNQKIGLLLLSLFQDLDTTRFGDFRILLDGVWIPDYLAYARDMIAEKLSIEKSRLEVLCGAKLDKKYPVVNIADGLAYYFFRQPLNKVATNPCKKEIILPN